MKLVLMLLFILNFNLLAEEYNLYTQNDSLITIQEKLKANDPNAKLANLFNSKEQQELEKLGINAKIIKIKTSLTQDKLLKLFPKHRIEKTGGFELYNQYESYQWSLNNPGGMITRWISDIDQIEIQADPSEDVNLIFNNETNKKVKIAIIDSGVDVNHPDLMANIHRDEAECQALDAYKECLATQSNKESCHEEYANQDHNQNGYPLDCNGWNMTANSYPGVEITGNPELFDSKGHGTHVAGIIAGVDNKIGIKGIVNNVELYPIQVAMNTAADNPIENIAKGMLYAIKNKVDVVNLSLGWSSQFDIKIMRDLVKKAIEQNILVVVAAGNSSHDDISYPCAYEDVICVGAHDPSGKLTSYSNFGTQVDLIAPGDRILSTWPSNLRSKQFTPDTRYEYLSGTSQAAPIVAGLLGELMSRGYTARQAHIALFNGARTKKEKSYIRFGNVDFSKALNASKDHLLYPLNKTPYLIKWNEGREHKFKLRIKNYGNDIKDAHLKIESLSSDQKILNDTHVINLIAKNEIFETDIFFNDEDEISSEIYFKLTIKSKQSTKVFFIKTQFVRLISADEKADDITTLPIGNKLSNDVVIRPFENITDDSQTDFFIHHTEKNKDYISILQLQDGIYQRSKPLIIKEKMPVFLNFSKVDVDLDGKEDYVIMYVYVNDDKEKVSKFVIIDHELKPKRIFLTPKNEFDNKKTFLPGKFVWLNIKNQMAPAWIGYGEDPSPSLDPWLGTTVSYSNYFYFLSQEGLEKVELPKDQMALHFLYQDINDKKIGAVDLITTKELGFKKQYEYFRFEKDLNYKSTLKLDRFFDLFEAKPLQQTHTIPHAFFHEDSIQGDENIFVLKKNKDQIESKFISLKNNIPDEAIQFVHFVTDDFTLYQTNHKLVLSTDAGKYTHFIHSKVNTQRRKYKNLLTTKSLYLPAIEAPGMTSEMIVVKNTRALVSHRRYRTLAINDCEEFGIIETKDSDAIGYICKEAQQILLLKVD